MKCDICGEGEIHLVCVIDEATINGFEHYTLRHEPILCDIPIYGKECDVCGLIYTGTDESSINRAIYVMLRREHGLPDSVLQRKWKET